MKFSPFYPSTDFSGVQGTTLPATRNVNLGDWNAIANGTQLNIGDVVQYAGSSFTVAVEHIKGTGTAIPPENPMYTVFASAGPAGQPTYTWFAYADSADGVTNFTTGAPGSRTYIGVSPNQTSAVESANPADYTWSKMQGPAGPAIVVIPDKPGFTFLNGVLNPSSQTITYTATLQNISGTINWTTSPNVKSGTGSTFTISTVDIGANRGIVVTASVGAISQAVVLNKFADPIADPTISNISAGFTGQGTLATKNTVGGTDLSATFGGPNLVPDGSFELGLPAITSVPDGGSWYGGPTLVTSGGYQDSNFIRFDAEGGHKGGLTNSAFIAQQTMVSYTVWAKDSGIQGTFQAASAPDAPHSLSIAVIPNPTANSGYIVGPIHYPAAGSGWTRFSGTITGLTKGQQYTICIQPSGWDGKRKLDVDALMVTPGDVPLGFAADLQARSYVAFDGSNLRESTGGAIATITNFKTPLGISAGFSGQGTLATRNSLAYGDSALTGFGALAPLNSVRFGANVYRAGTGPQVQDADAITSLGTAASIASQGALATVNTISTDSQLSGNIMNRLLPYSGDTNYLRADRMAWTGGNTVENWKPGEPGANITETRTSAAIVSQGTLATRNSADWATQVGGTGKPANNAGSTLTLFVTAGSQPYTFQGNSVSLPSGGSDWLGNFASAEGYTGSCAATFYMKGNSGIFMMCGISDTYSSKTTSSYQDLRYAFYRQGNNVQIYESGSFAQDVITDGSAQDTWNYTITYDGIYIRYYLNRSLVRAVPTTPGRLFVLEGAIATVSSVGQVYGISFTSSAVRPDINTDIYDLSSGNYATVPRNEIRTPLGTAAGITNQGSLATKSTVNYDSEVADGATYKKVKSTEVSGSTGVLNLSVAGSGKTLGDMRNVPIVGAAGGRYRFTGAVSYSASPTVATITVGAGSLIMGSVTIPYNSMSLTINSSANSPISRLLYVDTNVLVSGAHTLKGIDPSDPGAIAAVYGNDSVAIIASISFNMPSNTTTSGSGGTSWSGVGPSGGSIP